MEFNLGENQDQNQQNQNQIFSFPNQDNQSQQVSSGQREATIAARLLLIGSIIVNVTKIDNLLILASLSSITANFFLVRAAFLEANAQQIAPGVTTTANRLKIIGTTGSLTVALILFTALLIEVSIRQATGLTGAAAVAQAAGAGGAAALVVS